MLLVYLRNRLQCLHFARIDNYKFAPADIFPEYATHQTEHSRNNPSDEPRVFQGVFLDNVKPELGSSSPDHNCLSLNS